MATTLSPQLPDAGSATHPTARARWRARRRELFRDIYRPASRYTMSEWAERFRHLARENSAEPGPWRCSRVPYLVEIMDAVSDPDVEEMVIMKSAQVAYTEGVLNNAVGFFIDQDPSPIMVVQPSEGDAEKYSKKKLAPMIRATPRLRGRVAESRSRDSGNTILEKSFPGGFLAITGATSPKGLARESIRILLFDEVDRYPDSAGSEGDPVALGVQRTTTYPNRKIILGSTPTTKGRSRIERAFEETDKRFYHVPCPHCGHEQVLRWGGPDTAYGLKWTDGDPDSVAYLCEGCATLIEEHHKDAMVAAGRWVATNPDAETPGWHINALISLFDGARWPTLVRKWLRAKDDPEQLKTFINTVLGETWEEPKEAFEPEDLRGRREKYPAEVPMGVGLLTAGVDVQGDRLEIVVKGWGVGQESWLIRHERIYGDPEKSDVWERLLALLTRPYQHEAGGTLRIRAAMIDSGYATDRVYRFVRGKQRMGIYACKGLDSRASELLKRPARANRYKIKVWSLSTPRFKDIVFRRLRLDRPGPGYMHFCEQQEHGADAEYFEQFGAEEARTVRTGRRIERRYIQVRERNEAIDLEVYALAALHSRGTAGLAQLEALVERAQKPAQATPKAEEAEAATPARPRRPARRRSRGSYVHGWRP